MQPMMSCKQQLQWWKLLELRLRTQKVKRAQFEEGHGVLFRPVTMTPTLGPKSGLFQVMNLRNTQHHSHNMHGEIVFNAVMIASSLRGFATTCSERNSLTAGPTGSPWR
jgi:hypothetical protein